MHFSIPDTQEFYNETSGSSYTGYNIYINGNFHCCLRYKQLHSFHDQLKRSLNQSTSNILPSFPPKKILPLTPNQLEQRRLSLERYIQLLGQDSILSKSELLRTFLLNAQQETSNIQNNEINLDIYLMNGYHLIVNCLTIDYSTKVLEKIFQQNLNLSKEYINYFSLYLMKCENDGDIKLIRKLMDFESPYISQKFINYNNNNIDGNNKIRDNNIVSGNNGGIIGANNIDDTESINDCKIIIRKCYWDPLYDHLLMKDNVALNLLYIQTVSDVEREWIITTCEIKEQLRNLQERGNKREYLEIARHLPSYGCIKFSNSITDYPEPNTQAVILIGNKELSLRTISTSKIQETKFKVTRMRCWRVTTIHTSGNNDDITPSSNSSRGNNSRNGTTNNDHIIDNQQQQQQHQQFELAFEYLMNKNCLKWITISSEQAMLMSVCLQGMVDELINQKDGNDYNHFKTQHYNYAPLSYVRRDGGKISTTNQHHHQMSDSSSSDTISSMNEIDMPVQSPSSETFSFRRNSKNRNSGGGSNNKIPSTVVIFRNGRDSVQNEAFEGIGDDDL